MIDFFEKEILVPAREFGICDDEDVSVKTPAYIDVSSDNKDKWIACVTNTSGQPLNFIAVDNAIEIKRKSGEMACRCDAMLRNARYIVFIELKSQREKWIQHAKEQLLETIDVFKDSYDINQYPCRLAYACNKKHPYFAVSRKEEMQRFFQRNGVRLIIDSHIQIK